jgi:hypothetical protein
MMHLLCLVYGGSVVILLQEEFNQLMAGYKLALFPAFRLPNLAADEGMQCSTTKGDVNRESLLRYR